MYGRAHIQPTSQLQRMGSESTEGARPLTNLIDIEVGCTWFREHAFNNSKKTTTTTALPSSHLLQGEQYCAMKRTEMYTCREHRRESYLLTPASAPLLRLRRSSKPYWSTCCAFSSSDAELLRTPQTRSVVSDNPLLHQRHPGE